MGTLTRELRGKLEQAVQQARDVAEQSAAAVIDHLRVGAAQAPSYLTDDEKALRRALRAHGRQIGDMRVATTGEQETEQLTEEVAHEHWHRMLFARFLAENHLLMYQGVAITLEECDELAGSQGAPNGWEFAARLAAAMLPQIFRPDSPVFRITLPPEHQQQLEKLLTDLPRELFTATDSLGWVYQFWQGKRKDKVNAAEVKIGAHELPAVTQLFTEPYMVHFLLDNSLGAWWAGKRLTRTDLTTATSEQELRDTASLPGVPLTYLRFVRGEDGAWAPAAGTFPGWPQGLSDFSAMDPCSGSGHFLVSLFEMLVPMRMADEHLSADEAVDAVLRENIHGLELDRRCVELAAFNLALAAWRYPGASGLRSLPELNVACCGLAIGVSKGEWLALADGDTNLRMVLDEMYNQFADAPVLGSLIDPAASGFEYPMFARKWNDIEPLISRVLGSQQDEVTREAAVVAGGLAKTAQLLTRQYTLVTTNPPYLARGKQCDVLREFCGLRYPESKNDLATVFLERCLKLCARGGTVSFVLPQNWLFLVGYAKLREKLLTYDTWNLVSWLGPGAFGAISGEVVKAILFVGTAMPPKQQGRMHALAGIDVAEASRPEDKAERLPRCDIRLTDQTRQLHNPDARLLMDSVGDVGYLSSYAAGNVGVQTSDDPMFVAAFWELESVVGNRWVYMQGTPSSNAPWEGGSWLLRWEDGHSASRSATPERIAGSDKFTQVRGVLVQRVQSIHAFRHMGERIHQNVAIVVPAKTTDLASVWCYCSSPEYSAAVRRIDQKLNVTNATLVKVPFDLDRWTGVARQQYPHGLPRPYSDDPTQWIFHGHPCRSVVWDEDKKRLANGQLRTDSTVLQVAVARLLGYRWPAELDSEMELSAESREAVTACDSLLPFADKDGIVCIPSVRGEPAAADRLQSLLAVAYGDTWSADILSQLLAQSGGSGSTLEAWLRDKFFLQHCKMFQQRPFVWHVWDGLPDGFAALIDYHRLDRKTMETLIYTYLGSWIDRQRQDLKTRIDGTSERLEAALQLQKKLELILNGEKPYDIFVRWKPLSEQPIGWDPDLNDGVRLNIRPFVTAGVLRVDKKPALNISWEKDRGKDPVSAPWFEVFGGNRINDYHTTLEEKQVARRGH